jgi:hypothetical protein
MPSQTSDRLSTAEAAKQLHVSESYLAKLRCYGGGPIFMKFGARVLYAVADLETWAYARRRESTSDTDKTA